MCLRVCVVLLSGRTAQVTDSCVVVCDFSANSFLYLIFLFFKQLSVSYVSCSFLTCVCLCASCWRSFIFHEFYLGTAAWIASCRQRDVKAVVGQADRRRRRLTRAHLLIARSRGVCLRKYCWFLFLFWKRKKRTSQSSRHLLVLFLKNSCVIVVIIIDVDRVDYVHRLSPEVDYDGH